MPRSNGATASAPEASKTAKTKQSKTKQTSTAVNGAQARSMPKAPATIEAISLQVQPIHVLIPCTTYSLPLVSSMSACVIPSEKCWSSQSGYHSVM